jgi:16S rRNA (guanine966-N2)-methyltransferase
LSSPRIISGIAKGLRLKSVPGDSTRPITDRVKESLFNIIGPDILGASFLDLFGGTGSVGIEALSREADYLRILDINHLAITTIQRNLSSTRLSHKADVIHSDAISYITRSADRTFDYIYIAPPQYKKIWIKSLLSLNLNPSWLNETSWIIVQIHPIEYQMLEFNWFQEFDLRKYGSTLLVFYEKK